MTRHYTVIGLVVTAIWLGLGGLYAASRWSSFLALSPNELGDFLAGVLSPLAFLWLVLGYFQQGKELELSTNALRLQADELRNAVEQQRELVSATRDQVAFEKELNERTSYERAIAASPRFDVSGGGSGPALARDSSWRTFYIRIANLGAAVTAVKVFANGWSRSNEQIVSFPILDRGQSQRIELEMPSAAYTAEIELDFYYVNSLGQEGSAKLRRAADPTGTNPFVRVEG